MPVRQSTLRRRKERRRAANTLEAQATARMPIPPAKLEQLFAYLRARHSAGCDHTHRVTLAFLRQHRLAEAQAIPWLEEYGGCCDCEVLANVPAHWSPASELPSFDWRSGTYW